MLRVNEIKAELEKISKQLDTATEENKSLKALLSDPERIEYLDLKNAVLELKTQKNIAGQELINIRQQIEDLQSKVIILNEEVLLQEVGFYEPRYSFQNSEQYKLRLEDIRSQQKWLIKTEKAISLAISLITETTAKREGLTQEVAKLILRSFNSECDLNIANVNFSNVKAIEKKILNDFDALNKLGKRQGVSLAKEYLKLKLDELYLGYEYQAKKQDEKEEQKRIREQAREEAKLVKEIEAMKEKIEKEQIHFNRALTKIEAQLSRTNAESERDLLEKEKQSVVQKMGELERDLQDVLNREQNTRAGYVYIISNVGSFGDNIVKIGVTRRLDPTERVDELGDASVPYRFDIHAMIFSDDAPALENALHKAFEDKRLNLVNRRREFFNVSIDDIERVVKVNFNKPVEFIKMSHSSEYRESLAIRKHIRQS